MAPQKSPAFSFYAKDFLSGTAKMSLQEVGAYIRLLSYAWEDGGIPADASERARLMVCAKAQERELWKKVGHKFVLRDGAYVNERLEVERQKQAERRQRLSDNGKLGGRPEKANEKLNESKSFSPAKADANLNERLSSSSSSSSSVPPSKNDGGNAAPLRPLVSGEANPKTWGKIHGDHVAGFCDWVCLPEFVFAECVRKSSGADYVRQWATGVRAKFEGQTVGDNLKFWRVRWSEAHPEVAVNGGKPIPKTAAEIIAELNARDKARAVRS